MFSSAKNFLISGSNRLAKISICFSETLMPCVRSLNRALLPVFRFGLHYKGLYRQCRQHKPCSSHYSSSLPLDYIFILARLKSSVKFLQNKFSMRRLYDKNPISKRKSYRHNPYPKRLGLRQYDGYSCDNQIWLSKGRR